MRVHQVTALPTPVENDAMYFVLNGTYCETFITSNTGEIKLVGNSDMINQLVMAATASFSGFEIVADIAARDALTPTANLMVLVSDASADATVTSGAAMYAYDHGATTWSKVTEFESFNENVILNWSAIQGAPSSTPSAIDAAVNNSHPHPNKTQLDLIGGTTTEPTYNGSPILVLGTNNW